MSRKPFLGSTDISEVFLVLSCSSVCSHATTKCWYLSGFVVQRSALGLLEFEGSHASTKALQWFSTDRASGAVSDCPRLHLAGERSMGPTPRQHQLGLADSRVLPIALFSRLSSASVGFPRQRGVTSSVGWVRPYHTVPPACSPSIGSALGERKG